MRRPAPKDFNSLIFLWTRRGLLIFLQRLAPFSVRDCHSSPRQRCIGVSFTYDNERGPISRMRLTRFALVDEPQHRTAERFGMADFRIAAISRMAAVISFTAGLLGAAGKSASRLIRHRGLPAKGQTSNGSTLTASEHLRNRTTWCAAAKFTLRASSRHWRWHRPVLFGSKPSMMTSRSRHWVNFSSSAALVHYAVRNEVVEA